MTSEAWQAVGNIASTAGVTTFAIGGAKGIIAGYQTYVSPYTSLTEAERKLERVKSRLQGLSPKRREEIEIAIRSGSLNCSSLDTLEKKLESIADMHLRLSKRIEVATFTERHFPYSDFRYQVSRVQEHARGLLNDTLKTTVPCVDDIMFDPEDSWRAMERSSSSEPTSNPENSERAMERPSTSNPTCNPEASRRGMEGSTSSKSTESRKTARESFSDLDHGGIPLSRMV